MRFVVLLLYLLVLTACSSNPTKLNIMQINGLADDLQNDGSFKGLEYLANSTNEEHIKRVNIFYVHGIGWTEDPENDPLAKRFMAGIADAYDLKIDGNILDSQCGQKDTGDNSSSFERVANSIEITTGDEPIVYQTIIPGAELVLDKLVCMDRQRLKVSEELEFVLYRVFWDEIFWDRLQDPHVGQDDHVGYSRNLTQFRRKYNRRLKDEMVNYGFSDAVMYLGPAGQQIRDAVKGAMCAASLDASGHTFEAQGSEISAKKACIYAGKAKNTPNQFAFVSESLGSKITFDVMREAMTDGQTTILDDMIAGTEIYMLANQIALLSLSDLSTEPVKNAEITNPNDRPRIIALSEINDFLSYEINPFLENLWDQQYIKTGRDKPPFDFRAREALSQRLGFDFVDIRLEFADPIVGLIKDFVDPLQAHSKHVAEPEIVLLMLCGVKNGKAVDENCLAKSDMNDEN